MFELFKKDIKVGDKVRLYLTTGKEPEGMVVEIGDNYVLLQNDDQTQSRFFDKLIGAWDVMIKKHTTNFNSSTDNTNSGEERKIINETSIEEQTISEVEIQDNSEEIKNVEQLEVEKDNDKEFVLSLIELIRKQTDKATLLKELEPNADFIEIDSKNKVICRFYSTNQQFSISKGLIFDKVLLLNINNNSTKEEDIPIIMDFFSNKNEQKENSQKVSILLSSNTIDYYISLLEDLINGNQFWRAKTLAYFIAKNFTRRKNVIYQVIEQLKYLIEIQNNTKVIKEKTNPSLKPIIKEIQKLLNKGIYEDAIVKIDELLINETLNSNQKRKLLLRKAQAFSAIKNVIKAEATYQELIEFNKKSNMPNSNLSKLYTELARVQSLLPEKQLLALESINKAITYNKENNIAINLLSQFQGKNSISSDVNNTENDNLIVDSDDSSFVISKMIDIDINEHKYTNKKIIENGGISNPFLANEVFKIAQNKEGSYRFPFYLEAAKAFKELSVGSYDLQDYWESIAYYAMLKGNSLCLDFQKDISQNNIKELIRLKDSACSYYVESLNLLSSIKPELLLSIMANYLKLNVALYYLSNKSAFGYASLFKSDFAELFYECIRNKNCDLEKIAYQTIVSIGATSTRAWNKLTSIPGGTGNLYGEFGDEKRKKHIVDLVNEIEDCSLQYNLSPSTLLKNAFSNRKEKQKEFEGTFNSFYKISIEPHNFLSLIEKWESLSKFSNLFSTTDLESKEKVDEILSILKPYLNRNQTERTNLLIQAKRIIESQLKFIAKNTTFYGRTFFFPLLNKWEKEIDVLLEEKIAQSYPLLEVVIDPPYFVKAEGENVVNAIVKNIGETTTEGFKLNIKIESTEYEDDGHDISLSFEDEIPAGQQVSTSFVVPVELLDDSKAVEIEVDAIAIYQKKKIEAKNFQFTIEEEPSKENKLTYDDIVWNEGQIPEKHLFIGRQQIVNDLAQHYESVERHKSYILYGLTRTGKSSILKYLKENLQGDTFMMKGKDMTLLPFNWDLSSAASFKKASDFWEYALYQQVYEELETYAQMYGFNFSNLQFPEKPRAKDFPILLYYLQSKNIYPFFLIDEFSFIKTLIDGDIVNSAFLHTLRQYSLDGIASFIFAGTYDIKQLIADPKYGITGQLVNAIEEQINDIDDRYAVDLIEVMKDKLIFTPEAVSHIQTLSGNIPYFIQIICKYCGFYASENSRLYIGYPELEKVIKILTGKEEANSNSLVKNLPENAFQNNQFSPADPKEVNVLISSIVHFNRDKINNPRGVGFDELQKLWAEKGVEAFRPKLAESINLLKDKKILIQEEDEGMPVYKFAVDLFRRWWAVHHSDIDLEISTII